MSPKRWNGWLKLSEKTRKESDPRKYAAGKSIAAQSRERKESLAAKRIKQAVPNGRTSVINHNVQRMTDKDLDWTLKASPKDIKSRASNKTYKTNYGGTNPWWYR